MSDVDPVLYEERDDLAIITLNRPEKKNALTDAVIQGIADGIDSATASVDVVAVVIRGSGDTLTAGYDLTAGIVVGTAGDDEPGTPTPYGAKGPAPPRGSVGPGPRLPVRGKQRPTLHEGLGVPEARNRRDPCGVGRRCH